MGNQLYIDPNHTLEVLQHEWEVSTIASGKYILGTTHVRWCTAFYGYDVDHTIGFLAHFDWPFSERAIPQIFSEIEAQSKGKPQIKCFLIGGWNYSLYSNLTRWLAEKRIKSLVEAGWDIELNQKEFSTQSSDLQVCFCTMPIQFDIRTGKLSQYSRYRQLRDKGVPLANALKVSAQRRHSGDDSPNNSGK